MKKLILILITAIIISGCSAIKGAGVKKSDHTEHDHKWTEWSIDLDFGERVRFGGDDGYIAKYHKTRMCTICNKSETDTCYLIN